MKWMKIQKNTRKTHIMFIVSTRAPRKGMLLRILVCLPAETGVIAHPVATSLVTLMPSVGDPRRTPRPGHGTGARRSLWHRASAAAAGLGLPRVPALAAARPNNGRRPRSHGRRAAGRLEGAGSGAKAARAHGGGCTIAMSTTARPGQRRRKTCRRSGGRAGSEGSSVPVYSLPQESAYIPEPRDVRD